MALGILKKVSPEYVLGKAFLAEAKKKVEVVQGGMSLINTVGKLVGSSDDSKEDSNKAVNFLMEKMSEFDFSYKNMIKDSDTAKAVIEFEYPEVMEGTVDIHMIKQDKEWKIDNLSMPHFDKFSLPVKK